MVDFSINELDNYEILYLKIWNIKINKLVYQVINFVE